MVLGYGRIGRRVVAACEEAGREYIVIENDPSMRPLLYQDAEHFVIGDGMYEYVWEVAGVEDARLVISTATQRRVSEYVLQVGAGTEVLLRADGPDEAAALRESGASFVIVPDMLAAERLESLLRELLGGEMDPEELPDRHIETLEWLEGRRLNSRLG